MMFSEAFLMLVMCTAALLHSTEERPVRISLRCKCINPPSLKENHSEKIQNLTVIPAGPHCKTEQIIAVMQKIGRVCLNPTDSWVVEERKKRNHLKTG